jgi:Cu(I)/Ag(I) efflux system protein CusF
MAYLRRKMLCAIAVGAIATATASTAWSQTADASGEVRRVDVAAGKVAIKHDAISALKLPAMTLVYQADPALLANVKAGDKVHFTATLKNQAYVVTKISK